MTPWIPFPAMFFNYFSLTVAFKGGLHKFPVVHVSKFEEEKVLNIYLDDDGFSRVSFSLLIACDVYEEFINVTVYFFYGKLEL